MHVTGIIVMSSVTMVSLRGGGGDEATKTPASLTKGSDVASGTTQITYELQVERQLYNSVNAFKRHNICIKSETCFHPI